MFIYRISGVLLFLYIIFGVDVSRLRGIVWEDVMLVLVTFMKQLHICTFLKHLQNVCLDRVRHLECIQSSSVESLSVYCCIKCLFNLGIVRLVQSNVFHINIHMCMGYVI